MVKGIDGLTDFQWEMSDSLGKVWAFFGGRVAEIAIISHGRMGGDIYCTILDDLLHRSIEYYHNSSIATMIIPIK